MSIPAHRPSRLLVALLAGLPVLCAAGAQMPRLPRDRDLPRSADSPGTVTFSHAGHTGERADCTQCHPRLFPMTRTTLTMAASRNQHEEMNAGRLCGACHNGRAAFARDDCSACHRTE